VSVRSSGDGRWEASGSLCYRSEATIEVAWNVRPELPSALYSIDGPPPDADAPAAFFRAPRTWGANDADAEWWQVFEDPEGDLKPPGFIAPEELQSVAEVVQNMTQMLALHVIPYLDARANREQR
jgi:hypothetical protein